MKNSLGSSSGVDPPGPPPVLARTEYRYNLPLTDQAGNLLNFRLCGGRIKLVSGPHAAPGPQFAHRCATATDKPTPASLFASIFGGIQHSLTASEKAENEDDDEGQQQNQNCSSTFLLRRAQTQAAAALEEAGAG